MNEYLVYVIAGGFQENGGKFYNCQHKIISAESEEDAVNKWVALVFDGRGKLKNVDGKWYHDGYRLTIMFLPNNH